MHALAEIARDAKLPFGLAAANQVRALSDAYNTMRVAEDSLAARLAFFFARDVPKAQAAIRELRQLDARAAVTARRVTRGQTRGQWKSRA